MPGSWSAVVSMVRPGVSIDGLEGRGGGLGAQDALAGARRVAAHRRRRCLRRRLAGEGEGGERNERQRRQAGAAAARA